jgi:hypothetical protein
MRKPKFLNTHEHGKADGDKKGGFVKRHFYPPFLLLKIINNNQNHVKGRFL